MFAAVFNDYEHPVLSMQGRCSAVEADGVSTL